MTARGSTSTRYCAAMSEPRLGVIPNQVSVLWIARVSRRQKWVAKKDSTQIGPDPTFVSPDATGLKIVKESSGRCLQGILNERGGCRPQTTGNRSEKPRIARQFAFWAGIGRRPQPQCKVFGRGAKLFTRQIADKCSQKPPQCQPILAGAGVRTGHKQRLLQ